jgi:hypothetical protein
MGEGIRARDARKPTLLRAQKTAAESEELSALSSAVACACVESENLEASKLLLNGDVGLK